MTNFTCDVAVIGAGTAGLGAERSARRAGATTLLIDDGFSGTTCATVGCMPSKLLIAAGDAAHAVRQAPTFGIVAQGPIIKGAAVMARVRTERDRFTAGTLASIAQLPNDIALVGRARFTSATELVLDDGRTILAKTVVIATGSRPRVPAMFEPLGDLVLTNESIFELPDLPASVAVIGAGPLGLELAQAMARLGVEVTVFDQGTTIAGMRDAIIAAQVEAILARELTIHLGVEMSVEREAGLAKVSWTGSAAGERRFDRVLVATGRPPKLDGLGLEATGLALDDHDTPLFDPATMQCGASNIFIAGDADATRAILHEAADEGAIAGRNAASFPNVTPSRRAAPFSIMFTDPPLAVLGVPCAAEHVIGEATYDDQGRARVEARNVGMARLYADPVDGRLLGAAMIAPGAEHMAHLLAWAIERGESATTLLDLPFYHPTLEEGLKPALRAICTAVHAPIAGDQDNGELPGA